MIVNWRKPAISLLLFASGSNIPKALKSIKRLDNNSKRLSVKYHENKLINIIKYSHKHVPYYKRILEKSGAINRNRNVNIDKFCNIPVLTKKIIKNNFNTLKSNDKNIYKKGQYHNTSGGSTGEPIKIIQDQYYSDWNIANKIYYKLLAGQDIGNKELRLWGSKEDFMKGRENFSAILKNWLYNRRELNTFNMSAKNMDNYIKKWNKFKPCWVEAYIQSIYELSCYAHNNNLKIYPPENGIMTTAGTLYPTMKSKIEQVFKCKVYNRYGSREVGDIAFGDDHLNISYWNQHVEILNNNYKPCKANESGKIYITTLNNYSMPLIRYEIGDIGMKNEFFSLKKVNGRINSIIKTPKGSIDSVAIATLLYFDKKGNVFESFSKYQLVQNKLNRFTLSLIIQDSQKWKNEKQEVKNMLENVLGKNNLIIKEVKEIPPSSSGKYEYIKSEID